MNCSTNVLWLKITQEGMINFIEEICKLLETVVVNEKLLITLLKSQIGGSTEDGLKSACSRIKQVCQVKKLRVEFL